MATEHDPNAADPLVSPRAAGDDAPGTSMAASEPSGGVEVDRPVEAAPVEAPPVEAPAPTYEAAPPREAPPARAPSSNMLPQRERRRSGFERLIVRLIATCGIVGIGVAIAAIMVSSKSQGWIVGLVVSIVTVILAGLLWSSRML